MAPTPTYPLKDDIATIDAAIAKLEREAEQAQSSRAEATSEVASTQKAIRELKTARAQILEREALWERSASQLQSALKDRKLVADKVRKALATGGSLSAQSKTDLETALKAKAGIAPDGTLRAVYQAVHDIDFASANGDNTARDAWKTAATELATAEQDYAERAAAAEAAWQAITNGARQLEEQLQSAQERLTEATKHTDDTPAPPSPPSLNPEAAAAGLAWKDFVDVFNGLTDATRQSGAGSPDQGENDLVSNWESARHAARNALAVLLDARKTAAETQRIHEQRQPPRPGRSTSERKAVLEAVRTALTPPTH